MATVYKTFLNNDITTTRTLLHEAIPITGSIVSGTYGAPTNTYENVKNYAHGMFQSVYDYPYLSSSANQIFDITCGFSTGSALSASSGNSQQEKKFNVYNQMAQMLAGFDSDGIVREFDEDGDFASGGTKLKECYFVNFSRLLTKDEIKKGSFSMEIGTHPTYNLDQSTTFSRRLEIRDASGSDGYKVNSPAGDYGILYARSSYDGDATLSTAQLGGESITGGNSVATTNPACGLIYYQAGVAVLTGSLFKGGQATATLAFSNAPAVDDTIVITDYAGTAKTYTCKAAESLTDNEFSRAGATADCAESLKNCIEHASGHNGTITLTRDTATLTLTQNSTGAEDGASGNQSVTNGLTNTTFTGADGATSNQFTGGGAGLLAAAGSSADVLVKGPSGTDETLDAAFTGSTIEVAADNLRNRIYNISYNNTTELNSTIYFCRANHNDFNYSSNPTYTSASQILVKENTLDSPVTYITTVGLYSADNELLAVAKLSEPLKKTPETELTLRVRLDY